MARKRVLFQGSHSSRGIAAFAPDQFERAQRIAAALGDALIRNDLDLILNSGKSLDSTVGKSAEAACNALGYDTRERIRTVPYGEAHGAQTYFGMVLEPLDKRYQEVRTFIVREADAVVALMGGKGTSDTIQKALLARKPVFPIPIAGGGAQLEWERLRRERYCNHTPGDIDFLGDISATPENLAANIARNCVSLLSPVHPAYSTRIFIVHGHDVAMKNELARLLERLELTPVILHEQVDRGRTIFGKLNEELSDVGFGFVLLTPDDFGAAQSQKRKVLSRARQNVVFEHGWLVGRLGPERVCAIVKGDVELPSDLHGIVYKHVPLSRGLDSVALELVRELKAAGYDVDANRV
jgi:predicted nucleotide-binding protein